MLAGVAWLVALKGKELEGKLVYVWREGRRKGKGGGRGRGNPLILLTLDVPVNCREGWNMTT